MKTLKVGLSGSELNQFRFKVMNELARGRISADQARELLEAQSIGNRPEAYAAVAKRKEREYVRVTGMISTLSH